MAHPRVLLSVCLSVALRDLAHHAVSASCCLQVRLAIYIPPSTNKATLQIVLRVWTRTYSPTSVIEFVTNRSWAVFITRVYRLLGFRIAHGHCVLQ
jgi:hypothetical protein